MQDYSLSRVPSVPEHDLFAGELPGVVLEEEYSGEVCVQPAKSPGLGIGYAPCCQPFLAHAILAQANVARSPMFRGYSR